MLGLKTFKQAGEHFDDYETIEGSPRLYITPDGNFPSMTSLLSLFDKDSDWLEKWQKRVGVEEAAKITQDSINRGNSLHDLNEKYLLNQLKREDIKGPGKILFNRTKRYIDEIELVIGTEIALYNKDDKYAGRTDGIVMLDRLLTILDHKNSRKPININSDFGGSRKKLFKYQLQTCGYGRALYKMKGVQAEQGCLIIGNHETSTASVFKFPLAPFEKELDIVIDAYYNDVDKLKDSLYYQL